MTKSQYRAARALIADPEHWTTETGARDANDHYVTPPDPKAVKWCALGACWRIGGNRPSELLQAAREVGMSSAWMLNDRRGHAAVLAMFDRAIELAPE